MLGIGGKILLWVCDFLVGRTMCIKIAGEASYPKSVTSDLPQRSVFGSFLFLIYVNYIAASLRCCRKIFADDFKLHLSFPLNTCISVFQGLMHLQRDLDSICSVFQVVKSLFKNQQVFVIKFGGKKFDVNLAYYNYYKY